MRVVPLLHLNGTANAESRLSLHGLPNSPRAEFARRVLRAEVGPGARPKLPHRRIRMKKSACSCSSDAGS